VEEEMGKMFFFVLTPNEIRPESSRQALFAFSS